jgi:hypothetical protein
MADAVYRRFPGTTLDAVTAAIEAAGLTQSGLARFVNRFQEPVGAEWPKVAMTGEVAYRLAVALHEAGILDRVPPCTHCGRPRMVNSRGSAPPTCGACGPRNADGTKARTADPGKSICPAGLHRVPAYTLRCDACADEADTALIQDAILQAGASAELARTVISNVLLSRMSRRRVAEWLRASSSIEQDDAPPLIQRLRHALAAELPSVSRVRCACCGRERRVLPHQGESGRICENCYRRTPGRIETCRSCRKERNVVWRDDDGWAWSAPCRRRHPDAVEQCVRCGRIGEVTARTADGPVGLCCYQTPVEQCCGCLRVRPVSARTGSGPLCKSCARRPLERCANCGEERLIPRLRTRGRSGWCFECIAQATAAFTESGEGSAQDPDVDGIRLAICATCGRRDRISFLPDGPRCSGCWDRAMRRREECSRCGQTRRVFFTPGICGECLGTDIGGTCTGCGLEDRLYSGGRCERCVLAERAAEAFGDCGDAGRAVAARLAASPNPRSSLAWLEQSPTAEIIISILQHGHEPAHEDLDAFPSIKRADGKADRRQPVENARMILVSIGVLAPRNALAGRYETWALQVLAKVDQAADRWTLQQFHRHRLLPYVEARCEVGKATQGTVKGAQSRLRAAIDLMAWVRPRGGLARLSRPDIDEWFTGPGTRNGVREFLLWTIRQHLLDLPVSAVPVRMPQSPSDVEDYKLRADLAHKLLHEEGVPADVRVAGLLVVLYGQHLSRIVGIERENVDLESDPPRIKLGKNWLELPDPMGRHIAELLAQGPRRRGQFVEDARWLFLGAGAGTHLSSDRLGVRLANYGIHARAMRNTVLFQLGATVQPRTLARLLDLHTGTAVGWVNKAGGIYSNYWRQVLRDDDAEDLALFDPGLESIDDDDEDDPEDLLEELGIL